MCLSGVRIYLIICRSAPKRRHDTTTLTPEQIERMYISEMKVAGKTLRCFQGGTEIIHEVGLRDVKEDKTHISAVRLDGAVLDVILSDDIACTIVTRKPSE